MKIMLSKALVFAVIVLFVGAGVVPNVSSDVSSLNTGNTLYVGGSGPGNYSTILGAIDDADDGDTIYVYSGTYYENVVVDKAITLLGEEKETTIINGNKSGDVIYISADWVNISGFTIKNSGNQSGEAGVEIYSNYTTLSDNDLSNNQYGIYLTFSNDNNISKNKISINSKYAIYLHTTSDANIISDNIISGSEIGIRIKGSKNNNVFANTICNNERGIYLCCGARYNKLYHNTFKQNSEWNAQDSYQNNTWDNGYPSGGNYWDDYNGTDADGDGIGDAPYIIEGAVNNDNYPLITPYGNKPPNKPSPPTGETSGKSGEEYIYTSSTTDPDGDEIFYLFDWGNGMTSFILGPYNSGEECNASGIWFEKGNYEIKVKAIDIHGEESPWSDPLPITMPKNKAINPFLLLLERLIGRFPILEQILQPIYVYLG